MGNRALFLLIAGLSTVTIFAFNRVSSSNDLNSPTEENSIEAAKDSNSQTSISSTDTEAPEKDSSRQHPQVKKQEPRQSVAAVAHKNTSRRPTSAAEPEEEVITQKKPQVQELKTFSIALEDKHWKIWEGVTAIPEHKFLNRGQNLAGRLSGYILVKDGNDSSLDQFNAVNPIVVYNERRQIPGVVTGTLSIKIAQGVDVNLILDSYQLVSRDAFPQIRLYYVTARNQPFDLPGLFKALQKDPLIEKVDVEILDRQYEQ